MSALCLNEETKISKLNRDNLLQEVEPFGMAVVANLHLATDMTYSVAAAIFCSFEFLIHRDYIVSFC